MQILIIKPTRLTKFSNLFLFRTVPLSVIRSFSLYTQQWYMSYRFSDSLRAGSGCHPSWACSQTVSKPVWHTPFMSVQWKTPGDGQRNCPKHVEFHSKNKFKKLVHLVGFIIRIYHDARSPERQIWQMQTTEEMLTQGRKSNYSENITHQRHFACHISHEVCPESDTASWI